MTVLKKIKILFLLFLLFLLLSACRAKNDDDILDRKDTNQVNINNPQVPNEALQWFIDSGLLEYPDDSKTILLLSELDSANEMVAAYNSNIYCVKTPQGYYLYYKWHFEGNADKVVMEIDSMSLSESTLENSVISVSREDFGKLAKDIKDSLQSGN